MYFYSEVCIYFPKCFKLLCQIVKLKKGKSWQIFFLDPYQIILEKCFVGRGLKQMKRFLCSIVQYSTMMKIRYLTTLALTWNRPSIEIIFFFLSLHSGSLQWSSLDSWCWNQSKNSFYFWWHFYVILLSKTISFQSVGTVSFWKFSRFHLYI